MLEPFWIIVALIAIATIALFPVRMWYVRRYDRDAPGAEPGRPPAGREGRDGG